MVLLSPSSYRIYVPLPAAPSGTLQLSTIIPSIRVLSLVFVKECLEDKLDDRVNEKNSVLLSACRPMLRTDSILWIPISRTKRSRLVHWRLGWLPDGVLKPCICHPYEMLTRPHTIWCLNMHRRFQMSQTKPDPMYFLLKKPPSKRKQPISHAAQLPSITFSAWKIRRPEIYLILFELDHPHHGKLPPEAPIL